MQKESARDTHFLKRSKREINDARARKKYTYFLRGGQKEISENTEKKEGALTC
jgi:hypothetical protein